MATVENIQNDLINKILSIKDKEFLIALDKLISSNASDTEVTALTEEQKIMLEMSERDIENGNLISQEAMDKRNLEWLEAHKLIQRIKLSEGDYINGRYKTQSEVEEMSKEW